MKKSILTQILCSGLVSCGILFSGDTVAAVDEQGGVVSNYAPKGWLAKSLPELAEALRTGTLSSEALVESYLARIKRVDRAGPMLQSVLTLNSDALAQARALDARRKAGETLGPLHGLPLLVKDNIESKDAMATTAGALALKDNVTGRNSPLVAGLRNAGAVILGKTNLSQWANFRSENSMSGWSALGGQVRNPHMLDRNPCGSSSGSGAATAASLAAGAVGTETNGSIICPSTVNGIVGFKPTVGLVSQQYIIPISSSQDTAGPMTKTVKGAAMMLDAMATGAAKTDYSGSLDAGSLQGTRVGVLRFAEGSNRHVKTRFEAALAAMKAAGAELVEIEEFEPEGETYDDDTYDVLKYEFKHTLNEYLAATPPSVKTRTLAELIAFNNEHADIELALFDQGIFEQSEALGGIDDPAYIEARTHVQRATRERGIDLLMQENDVRVLVAPSGVMSPLIDPVNGDVWPSWAGAGELAAVAGYPHLTVPMGSVKNLPVGISFIGGKDQDAAILSYGFAYEQATRLRPEPAYLESAEDRDDVAAAMQAAYEQEPEARWLAGDHHIHSRYSVSYDEDNLPAYTLGGGGVYPIPMNALMARHFGLAWTVATDHGGPDHSKINFEVAYPELQLSRAALPEIIQFFGLELNTPAAGHSSIIMPYTSEESRVLSDLESSFDRKEKWTEEEMLERDQEDRMIEALRTMDRLADKPVVIIHHPSRNADGLGEYGSIEPRELRNWNDAAPDVAVGMEGAPGHQAGLLSDNPAPRGWYSGYPTMGGFDQMTARLGGFWDAMLGEGRRWWITANSDSHRNFREGGVDFWPGQYSKTYVHAKKDHASILESLRRGRIFVTIGDLISELDVDVADVKGEAGSAQIGGTITLSTPGDIKVRIRARDPHGTNHNGDSPEVARIDLIIGHVTGPNEDRTLDTNESTTVVRRFSASDWQTDGETLEMSHTISVSGPVYIRVRGTNTNQLEPGVDPADENPWQDLWFYSNPVFVEIRQ